MKSKIKSKIEFAGQPPLRHSKLGDQLYEKLLERIASGHLPEGSRLPSESQLCEAFGISRPVVREALSRLQADGVIVSRHGSGSYVQRRPNKDFFSLAPIGGVADLMRCMEFRIALEGEAAYLAAERRTEADLRLIERGLRDLDEVIANGEVGSEADIRFHNAIAIASQNRLFERAMGALSEYTLQGMNLARKLSLRRNAKRLETVQHEHVLIYEAIKQEDPVAAREAMRTHINNARIRILTDSTEP